MHKPRKNEPRRRVQKILHPFFKIEVYDPETGDCDPNVPLPDEGDPLDWRWDGESGDKHALETDQQAFRGVSPEDNYFDLSVILPPMQKVYEENKDKYNEIILTASVDRDGYSCFPRIVGERQETDKEYNARVQKLHDDYNAYVKQRDEKKKVKADQKKDKITQLKKELERLEGKK